MKKPFKKSARSQLSLGQLISTVSTVSRSNREMIATVADLLESGRVRLATNGRKVRARVI